MTEQEPIATVKLCILGSSAVGKTCLLNKKVSNAFNPHTAATIGGSYIKLILTHNNQTLVLDCWDTAGQERYRSMTSLFYRDAYIVLLVYDITNEKSYADIKENWYKEIMEKGEENKIIIVVGNKCDLYEQEQVDENEVKSWASSIGAYFCLTSALKGTGIDEVFNMAAKAFLDKDFFKKWEEREKIKLKEEGGGDNEDDDDVVFDRDKKKKKCCH